jgi:hypothetical protein
MPHQFKKHYTREEARALLPDLRQWLERLNELGVELERIERRLAEITRGSRDVGGELVNGCVRRLAELRDLLRNFHDREIIIKDLPRGLVDFPALIGNREVFLCWEKDEEDIEFWHEIDSGYAGREPL